MEGATFFRRKKEWALFGDFYLRMIGKIADGGFLVCSFGARVLGRSTERYDYSVESSFLEFGGAFALFISQKRCICLAVCRPCCKHCVQLWEKLDCVLTS